MLAGVGVPMDELLVRQGSDLARLAGVPVLVLVGEEDEVTPPARARAMAEAIPGARVVVIPGAGHVPPLERPAATTQALLEFLHAIP